MEGVGCGVYGSGFRVEYLGHQLLSLRDLLVDLLELCDSGFAFRGSVVCVRV